MTSRKQLSRFESQTGFTLPDDLETILGDNLMVAVDKDGLTFDNIQNGNLAGLNAGVRFTSDPEALGEVYTEVIALVKQSVGHPINISKTDTSDGFVLATNDSYAQELATDGALGESSDFTSVIDDAADQEFVAYLDWDAIEDEVFKTMEASSTDASMQDIEDNLSALRAFGVSSGQDGDYVKTTFKVSVN